MSPDPLVVRVLRLKCWCQMEKDLCLYDCFPITTLPCPHAIDDIAYLMALI